MSHDLEGRTLEKSNKLKENIESNEILLMTEMLEARRQVASKIEEAKKKYEQEYQTELRKLEEKKNFLIKKAKDNYNILLEEITEMEGETLQEISNKFEQRENQIIKDLLQTILP